MRKEGSKEGDNLRNSSSDLRAGRVKNVGKLEIDSLYKNEKLPRNVGAIMKDEYLIRYEGYPKRRCNKIRVFL